MTTVTLPFPISVNAMFSNGRTGRHKSQRYADWLNEAGYSLMVQRPKIVKGPVVISCLVQDGRDGRKRDITNLIKGPEDLLVSHGIIEADDSSIVREVKMKWSKDVQGIQITITPVEA
ncbi:RusA family crossover junction endodeoxyribonuclease [Tardiphaga sp. 538_B7_N1_4]|uniref:RusA family crossover junction endodeoxyribonuclease n=1 Tax=Tardiphaga sp. 538_B7_N1_4 TaxID=3240778 RepID=UPI003F290F62